MEIPLIKRMIIVFTTSAALWVSSLFIAPAIAFAGISTWQDAYTTTVSPTSNFAASPTLNISPTDTTYLHFNVGKLTPPGYTSANVAKAILKVYVKDITAPGNLVIKRITSPWQETVTGLTAPTLSGAKLTLPVGINNKSRWLEYNITFFVKNWLDGTGIPNLGIALKSAAGLAIKIDSKENTAESHEPQLEIVYQTAASSNVLLSGNTAHLIGMNRNTDTAPGNSLSILGGGAHAGSTDLAGGDLLLSGGLGTGLGGGGNIRFQTAGADDSSGSADNLLVDRHIIVAKAKPLTLSAPGFASLLSIHLTGTHTAGGRIHYTIRATDGGGQIATESGIIQYLATANSITCTVDASDKLHLGTVNSGCSPGFFSPGSQPGVSIFDNVSFFTPAPVVVHEVYYEIENTSGSPIRLEP